MSNRIELTEIQSHIIRAIEEDSLETPIKLITELGFDKSSFFKGSCFSGLDLRNDDLSGVNFDGTKLIKSKLLESQLKFTQQFEKTTFVDCEFYADTKAEDMGVPHEESDAGQDQYELDNEVEWHQTLKRSIDEAQNALFNLEQAWNSIEVAFEDDDRITSYGEAIKELKHFISREPEYLDSDLIQIAMEEINAAPLDLPDSVLAFVIALMSACDNILEALDND